MADKTQIEKIKEILKDEGKIDNFRCFSEMISLRLGARIQDLEEQGWRFKAYKDPQNKKNYIYELISAPEEQLVLFT